MPLEEVMRDTTAMGGLAVYVLVGCFAFVIGKKDVSNALLAGLVLCYIAVSGIRFVFFRKRPDRQKYRGFFTKIDAGSFPSMHATRITVLAFVLWLVFPQSLARVLLVLAVLSVIGTRIMLKRHYATDVIAGIVLGVLIGWASAIISGLA